MHTEAVLYNIYSANSVFAREGVGGEEDGSRIGCRLLRFGGQFDR